MPTFNTYQQTAVETPLARKWFIRALIASLIIHAVLFAAFRSTKLESFTPYTERLVPRNFTLGRVAVNENVLSDESDKKQEPEQASPQAVPKIEIPTEKPSADANPQDVVFKPTGADVAHIVPITTENPKATDNDLKSLAKMEKNVSKELDNDLNKVNEQLIGDKTPTSSKSVLKFSENTKPGAPGNPADDSAVPGTKSLDEALSSTGGGLQSGDTIGIRGGALFAYDSAELHPDATTMDGLQKLVTELKRHPNATLIINGYADSIGSITDPQYNKDLSQRRADAMKAFFQYMGIDASQMQAVGNGSTKFIDPPTYDPAKQALEQNNRRVEIVLTFPH